MAREDRPGDVRLVAYFVPRPGMAPGDDDAASPPAAQPARVHGTAALRGAPGLPADAQRQDRPQARCRPRWWSGATRRPATSAPATETERIVAQVWADALGVQRVGMHDDFFALGGHSLLAAQVIGRLARELAIVLPMRRMFEAPTVARFAPLLAGQKKSAPITRWSGDGPAAASFMQERTWNLEQLQPGRAVFNLPSAFRLAGKLDVEGLERALNAFVDRHEAARTTLSMRGPDVVQVVAPELRLALPVTDLSALPLADRERELMVTLLQDSIVPFDLVGGPLVRARLFRMAPEEHVVFFMPHHAIWDGWSFDILVRDLAELYDAAVRGREPRLVPLPIRYRDFAAWHGSGWTRRRCEQQAEYWRDRLGGDLPPLDLPTDRPRPRAVGDAGATLWVGIPRAEVETLAAVARRHGVTLFMLMLAAYQTLLHRYSGQRTDPGGHAGAGPGAAGDRGPGRDLHQHAGAADRLRRGIHRSPTCWHACGPASSERSRTRTCPSSSWR